MAKKLSLVAAWKEHLRLITEGNKLHTEGYKLYAESDKLYAGGNKLRAEGNKLRAEGNELYCDAVIAAHGPKAIINWETGEFEV